MTKNTLWIFGSSLCLPFNLNESVKPWPDLLADQLGMNCVNLSEPGADNFFIYQNYLYHKKNMHVNDTLIMAWSHYSRKCFVFDKNNAEQNQVYDQGLRYYTGNRTFIRNVNAANVDSPVSRWLSMKPKNTGRLYYDNWFQNYYSEYEQKCNFQSYLDSVNLSPPCRYLPLFFSKESVQDLEIKIQSKTEYLADYIFEHDLSIGTTDAHLSENGHVTLANHVFDLIDQSHRH
jgi:hypothetical protein